MRPTLLAVLLALAAPAGAGETGDQTGLTDIPAAEWAAMAEGRTLTYEIDGALWARERYHAGTDQVTLEFYDGTCMEGRWDHAPPHYCFHWEAEGTSCFRHVRNGGEILILETRDGVETGAVQTMTGVSDAPLACGGAIS